MKLSILFYPNRDKTNAKTGKIPMYMRITLNRKKAEMRLNVEATEADLLKWELSMMRFTDRSMTANAYLNELDQKFEHFKYHNATTLSEFDPKAIRNLIMGLDGKPSPLIESYVDKYYNKAIAPNAQMAEGTKRNYRKAFKCRYFLFLLHEIHLPDSCPKCSHTI